MFKTLSWPLLPFPLKKISPKFILSLTLVFASLGNAAELTVYVSDSLLGKGSLGEALQAEFARSSKNRIRYVAFSSAGEAMNQVEMEGKNSKADVVLGVDRNWLGRAVKKDLYAPIPTELYAGLPPEMDSIYKAEPIFLPYDQGYLTFLYDDRRTKGSQEFGTLLRFLDQAKNKRVAIQDPRTSSLGYSFLVSTYALWGDKWKERAGKVLSNRKWVYGSGWTGTYGLFLKGDFDNVLSYTTSPAYHIEKEQNTHIRAIQTNLGGNYLQVEGALIPKSSTQAKLAGEFLQLLLSPAIQKKIPTTNWMYPVKRGIELPKSFDPNPRFVLSPLTPQELEVLRPIRLKEWVEVVSGKLAD